MRMDSGKRWSRPAPPKYANKYKAMEGLGPGTAEVSYKRLHRKILHCLHKDSFCCPPVSPVLHLLMISAEEMSASSVVCP
jgi:hypothetical protein